MAREHLLLDQEEESIHSNQIRLETKKEQRKNWWHYHKMIVLAVSVAVLVVGSIIYSVVSQVEPDYQIGLITSRRLPESMVEDLESYLMKYCDDRNTDGERVLKVRPYILSGDPQSESDAAVLEAAVVQFTGDSSELESVIFLHDPDGLAYFPEDTLAGFFQMRDGSQQPEDATSFEEVAWDWTELQGLANYRSPGIDDSFGGSVAGKDVDALWGRYRVSLRSLPESMAKKEEKSRYYEDSVRFFQRMMEDQGS